MILNFLLIPAAAICFIVARLIRSADSPSPQEFVMGVGTGVAAASVLNALLGS